MTIVYEESRSEQMTKEGMTVTRTLRVVPYADRGLIYNRLMGGVLQIGLALYRFAPANDPWYPWCYVQSVDSEGVGMFAGPAANGLNAMAQRNAYSEGARLKVTYKTLDHDQDASSSQGGNQDQKSEQQEIDLATESYDYSATQLTLPNKRFGWANPASLAMPVTALLERTDTAATKTLARVQYSLQRHLVIRLPQKAITQQLGRLNKSPFRVGFYRWPAETLRFEGATASRKVTVRGIKFFEMTYKFAINPIWDTTAEVGDTFVGWNRLFRPDTGQWQRVRCAALNKQIYEYDEDAPTQTLRGRVIKGFKLLFHPAAR